MEHPPFPAYEGDQPYVFVCYSHADASIVYPELERLREQGLNIWYDEGVSPGTVWRDELAHSIENAATLLFFVSPSSVQSANCQREVHFALDQERRIVAVYLQPAVLPAGLRLAMLHRQAIHRYELPLADYERKILRSLAHDASTSGAISKQRDAAAPRHDRVLVGVESAPPGANDAWGSELVGAVTRYISWHGGAFRAVAGAPMYPGEPNYRVVLRVDNDTHGFRIAWQLAHVSTAEVVWASRFNTAPDATLDPQRIAEMIAEGLLRQISDHVLRGIGDDDAMTYSQLVLKAGQLHYLDRMQVTVRERQVLRAIELEPRTGLGYALLAELLSWKIANGISEDRDDADRLNDAAQTALRLDPNDPQVLLSVGITRCRVLDYTRGLSLIRRSLALAPTVNAKDELARSLCFAGEPIEAIKLFREILDTMPAGHTFPFGRLALALTQAGLLEEALVYSTLATVHFPDDYYGWIVHANVLAQIGQESEGRVALAEAQRMVKGLRIDVAIERTEAMYGHSAEQRAFLTGGLRKMLSE